MEIVSYAMTDIISRMGNANFVIVLAQHAFQLIFALDVSQHMLRLLDFAVNLNALLVTDPAVVDV